MSPAEAAIRRGLPVTHPGWMAYAIAVVVVALDQLSKFWVLEILDLDNRPAIEVLPVFRLSMVWNEGVSFGLFRADSDAMRWLLVAFAVVVVVVLVWWAGRQVRRLPALALGLIIGGAIGNGIDRFLHGAVVDFALFHLDIGGKTFNWYVFNLADVAIVAGVAGLLYDSFLGAPAAKAP